MGGNTGGCVCVYKTGEDRGAEATFGPQLEDQTLRAHPPKPVGSPISGQPRRQGHCASDEQTFPDDPHHAESADDP